jgi:Fe2+ or Zn2+ uptake regulation protein
VTDLDVPIDVSIPVAERHGFAVASIEVVFRGLCADCGPDAA